MRRAEGELNRRKGLGSYRLAVSQSVPVLALGMGEIAETSCQPTLTAFHLEIERKCNMCRDELNILKSPGTVIELFRVSSLNRKTRGLILQLFNVFAKFDVNLWSLHSHWSLSQAI